MVHDLNLAASRSDGKRTFSPMLASFLGAITLFVFYFVWNHQYANRLGNELRRRGINYKISAFHFWIFGILLSFTIVCTFIYLHDKSDHLPVLPMISVTIIYQALCQCIN